MQDRLEHLLARFARHDRLVDAIGGVVGKFDQQQKLRKGVVLALDTLGEPAPGDLEDLRKAPHLDLGVEVVLFGPVFSVFAVLSEILFQGELGEQESNLLLATRLEVIQPVDAGLSDDRPVLGDRRNVGRGQRESRIFGEPVLKVLIGDVIPIAQQAGECDLAVDAVLQGSDTGRHGAGFRIARRARAGDKREGDAVDFGVFRLEPALFIDRVAHPPQAAPYHLLAKQLGAERPNAQDVGDGVGVPAFGKHGNADDAFDVFAELADLAHGVHHFAEEIFVGQRLGVPAGEPDTVLGLEILDLHGGDFLELGAHRLARLQLLAVDQDRVGPVEPLAAAVVVAEDVERRGLDDRLIVDRFLPARHVIVDELGDVGVVANDDKHRRHQVSGPRFRVLFPLAIRLFVVGVQAMQGAF